VYLDLIRFSIRSCGTLELTYRFQRYLAEYSN